MITKFRKKSKYIFAFLIFPITGWATEENIVRFPPSSVLCMDEKSTGFNWRDRGWVQTNFAANSRFIIRKLDIAKYQNKSTEEKWKNDVFFCENPTTAFTNEKDKKFNGVVKSCYEIKDMGSSATLTDSQMCSELWRDGQLQRISCRDHSPQFYFNPEGAFIRFPWHTDIDKSAAKKDSLALSVGSCSVIK
jgi:hypothetical protein